MKIIRFWLLFASLPTMLFAQKSIPFDNLDAFTNPAGNWKIVGDAIADPFTFNDLQTTPGTGVLANIHEHGSYGPKFELISKFEHGDADFEFDFMMANGANSGFYLQGNYEIQLFDSWGKKNPKYNDCGGIYERWDESKPEGQKGYEGTAPRINACKAPGLWQHMKISFQAARFDASGKKIENAKILSIYLNGMLLHENVELSGVTRGALSEKEVAKGPIRIQGDHSSIALKNLTINNFDQKPASLSNLTYKVNYEAYNAAADPYNLKTDASGSLKELSWEFLTQKNEYSYTLDGDFNAPADGSYTFTLFSSSNNSLSIDGKAILENKYTGANDARTATVDLKKGVHKFSFYNAKYDGWMAPALGLFVAGPGFRSTPLHAMSSMIGNKASDPILMDANTITNLRSFMDITEDGSKRRIVHNINVGFPDGIHYSYDLDKGALFQVWRGGFLNTTPMWDSRGDGSSRPMGAVTALRDELFVSNTLPTVWPKDSTSSNYKPKGYSLDSDNIPTFHYQIFGATVHDKIVIEDGKFFHRTVNIEGSSSPFYAKIAEGNSIEKVKEGLYAINNRQLFIKLSPDATVILRNSGNKQELIVQFGKGQLDYQLIF